MKTLIVLVLAIVFKTALSRPGGGPFDSFFSGGFGDLFKDFNDDNGSWKTTSFKESPFSNYDMSSLLGSNMDLSELGEPVVKSKTLGPVTKQDGPVTTTYGGSVHTAQWGPKMFSSSGPISGLGSTTPPSSCGNKSLSVPITSLGDNILSEKMKNNPSPWGKSGPNVSTTYSIPASQQKPQGLGSSPSTQVSKAEPTKSPPSSNSYGTSSPKYPSVKSGASTPSSPSTKPTGVSTPSSPSNKPYGATTSSPSPYKPSTSSASSYPPKAAALPQTLYDDIVPISLVLAASIPNIGGEVQVQINTDGLTAEEVEPFSQDMQQRMEEYFGVPVESHSIENVAPYD